MAFGFPAHHTAQFSAAAKPSTDLHAAVRVTLKLLGWPIKDESSDRITASASISLWSWGERIVIDFRAGNSIAISSKCAFPLQCIDWGKNKRNVDQFIAKISKHT